MRFYWNVLRSIHACHAFLLECFSFDYAWCLPPVRQTERLAICCVPIPPWGEIAIRAFSNRRFDYQFPPPVHFRPERFFMAIPTGNEETRERGERSRRRGARALLREHIGFAMFPAGSTLGQNVEAGTARRPRLRQGDSSPWTLFI
ncbi:MAG: hypothetical protein SOT57_09815 [Eubacteriales bacterium]|nr:hypothetical protein [Eubacteriales bacterium]